MLNAYIYCTLKCIFLLTKYRYHDITSISNLTLIKNKKSFIEASLM